MSGRRDTSISDTSSEDAETREAEARLREAEAAEVGLLHRVLMEGAVFVKHSRRGSPKYKNVIVRPGIDMVLEWSDVPDNPEAPLPPPSGSIKLSDITMLIAGKESKVFKRKVAASAPEWLCFSMLTKTRTLDLQAHSGSQRNLWVRAITNMVQGVHRNAAQKRRMRQQMQHRRPDESPRSGQITPSVSLSQLPTDPVAGLDEEEAGRRVQPELRETKMMSFLTAGGTLIKHGRHGAPKQKHIFCTKVLSSSHAHRVLLLHSSTKARSESLQDKLFWCKVGKNPSKATTHIVLGNVKGVLLGKKTLVFGRRAARNAQPGCCFSIITEDRTLDFQAVSREHRTRWVDALRHAIKNAKKRQELVLRILESTGYDVDSSDGDMSSVSDSTTLTDITESEMEVGSVESKTGTPVLGSALDSPNTNRLMGVNALQSPVSTDIFEDDDSQEDAEVKGSSGEDEDEDADADADADSVASLDSADSREPGGEEHHETQPDEDPNDDDSGEDSPPPPPPPLSDDEEAVAAYNLQEVEQKERAQKRAAVRAAKRARKQKAKQKRIKQKKRDAAKAKKEAKLRAMRAKQEARKARAEIKAKARAEKEARKRERAEAEAKAEAERRAEAERVERERNRKLARSQNERKAVEERENQMRQQEEEFAKAEAERLELQQQLQETKARASRRRSGITTDEKDANVVLNSAGLPVKKILRRDAGGSGREEKKSVGFGGGGTDAPPKKKGIVWRQQIEEVKHVEKIIILAPEYEDDYDDYDSVDMYEDLSSDEEGVSDDEDEDDDEEEKERQLEPIAQPKRFIREIQSHRRILDDMNQDWSNRTAAMNAIEDLIRNKNVAAIEGKWWAEMKDLTRSVCAQLEDLRSSVVKEACNLLITLTDIQGHTEQYVSTLKTVLPVLFRRLYVTIKVISTSADECVRAVLTRAYFWSFRCIPEMLRAASQDTHSVVRAKCTEYLTQILNECPDDQFKSVFVYEKRLASLIKQNINDADRPVRAASRQLFLAFANVWPQLAHKLYDKFNTSTQRTITQELKRMMT